MKKIKIDYVRKKMTKDAEKLKNLPKNDLTWIQNLKENIYLMEKVEKKLNIQEKLLLKLFKGILEATEKKLKDEQKKIK